MSEETPTVDVSNLDYGATITRMTKETWDRLVNLSPPEAGELSEYATQDEYKSLEEFLLAISAEAEPWTTFNADADKHYVASIKAAIAGEPIDPDSIALFNEGKLVYIEGEGLKAGSGVKTKSGVTIPVPAYPPGMSDDDKKTIATLFALLNEVNGQDAYSVTTMALGSLKSSEYLVLPENLRGIKWPARPADVGKEWSSATSPVTHMDFVNIYALNKQVGADTKDPVFFALVRAEAVKMGWFANQQEVRYAVPPADALSIFAKDSKDISEALESSRSAAFLIPFMGEYVFRTTGHHYLSGIADEYDRKYQAICSACLVPDLTRKLRSAELWHKALHWVGPARTREVITALANTARLPNAIAMRKDAAPAGTALVTTTNAVIEALESCNWANEVAKCGGFDFNKIKEVTKAIKSDVTKYHTAYYAYNVAPPTAEEKEALASAILEAQKFAPVAQGFVDAMYTDSSLGRAKALRKHADASPVLMRRALRVFRNLARAETEEIADIFKASVAEKKAVAEEAKKEAPA